MDLKGKNILILGASGQIGRCLCKQLKNYGANIIAHYNKNKDSIPDEIIKVRCDLTNYDDTLRMKNELEVQPDILIDCVYSKFNWETILNQPLDDYVVQFYTQEMSIIIIAKIFTPKMIEEKKGKIIAINSVCAFQNGIGQSAYVSGKKALDGIMKVLARELAPYQITVNQIVSGWVITEEESDTGIINDSINSTIPMGHRGTHLDIANTVAFLCSDLSNYITGAAIPLTGGVYMNLI